MISAMLRTNVVVLSLVIIAAACLSLKPTEASTTISIPQNDQYMHMGVATCASSNCHASKDQKSASNVDQTEYNTWLLRDRHAKAYRTLESKESRLIGEKLGIKEPSQSTVCLDCHADNVSLERRGPEFQITDGVGCEACHGGSEVWLSRHTLQPNDAARNLRDGMYQSSDLGSRVKLCAGCHLGNSQKSATHQIMGAGHPRLSFELDAFTERQPAHHRMDGAHATKTNNETSVRRMLVGTAVLGQLVASNMTGKLIDHAQGYPELTLFDCHSCHHPLSDLRWQPSSAAPKLKPGMVRLNDSVFKVLAELVGAFDPGLENSMVRSISRLQSASQRSIDDLRVAALEIYESAQKSQAIFEQKQIKNGQIEIMVQGLAQLGADGALSDYSAAEYAVICLDSLSQELPPQPRLETLLNQAYEILTDDDQYSEAQLRIAMSNYLRDQ
ncbi:MAG: hypothetical protein ACI9LY_002477 [Arenicella sp.]